MARLKKRAPEAINGVPAAFLDPAADAWHDERSFLELLDQLGLTVAAPSSPMRSACSVRRAATLRVWAAANGLMSKRWPNMIDRSRLAELGITNLRSHYTCTHSH